MGKKDLNKVEAVGANIKVKVKVIRVKTLISMNLKVLMIFSVHSLGIVEGTEENMNLILAVLVETLIKEEKKNNSPLRRNLINLTKISNINNSNNKNISRSSNSKAKICLDRARSCKLELEI